MNRRLSAFHRRFHARRPLFSSLRAPRLLPLFLALVAPAAISAQPDGAPVNICARSPDAVTATRDAEADALSKEYLKSNIHREGPSCNWTCDSSPVSGRKVCMGRLEHVLDYNCSRTDHQQGRSVTDQQYYADAEARWEGKGGPLLQPPRWLVTAATRGNGGDASSDSLTSELRDRDIKYLEFKSTSVENDGQSFRRVLVLLEGPKFDQWIQIAVDKDGKALARNIDLIAVEKKDPSTGADLVTPNVFFKGYSRSHSSESFEPEGVAGSTHRLTRCYSCHSSGLRTVIPDKRGEVTAYPSTSLAYFQGLMARSPMNLGPAPSADKSPSYEHALNGPPMGAATSPTGELRNEETRLAVIEKNGCAHTISIEARARVARAMNCSQCHTGRLGERGILNVGTDLGTIRHKIGGFKLPERAYMPPADRIAGLTGELTAGERTALMACLRLEYAEDLKSWLKVDSCSAPDLANCPPKQQEQTNPLDGNDSAKKVLKAIQAQGTP